MNLEFLVLEENDLPQYKKDMQEAFRLGAVEGGFPEETGEILPEGDINRSLAAKGAIAYKAVSDGAIVGGAIVVIDEKKHEGHLDFLYVKHGVQSRGIGKFMWFEIERLHPEVYVWETCTPYFEKRNLHFYVNVCGFRVTEFWNDRHPDPHEPFEMPEGTENLPEGKGGDDDGMFGFRKEIHRPHGSKKISVPFALETERLTVRTFKEKDLDAYYRLVANPRVNCFRDAEYGSMDDARAELAEKQKNDDATELAVARKDTDEFIGLLFGMWEGDTFSVGWNFLPEFCGKGYAREAAKAYFDLLFDRLNVRRIYAYTEDDNLPSQKLCEKLGMRREGLFREFISFVNNPDGTPHYENTYQYAILKNEWNTSKNAMQV